MKEVKSLKKTDIVKLSGIAAMALGFIATAISNWSSEQAMKKAVKEEVEDHFAKLEQEKEPN